MAVQFDVGELDFLLEAFVAEKPFQRLFSIGIADAMVGVPSSSPPNEKGQRPEPAATDVPFVRGPTG